MLGRRSDTALLVMMREESSALLSDSFRRQPLPDFVDVESHAAHFHGAFQIPRIADNLRAVRERAPDMRFVALADRILDALGVLVALDGVRATEASDRLI